MRWLYRFGTAAYHTALRTAARLGNDKAKQWVEGRRTQTVQDKTPGRRRVWIHCASLGEWEQGRPVLEALQRRLPEHDFVLSFYSPSGYERQGADDLVSQVLYLPEDTPTEAQRWMADLQPDVALFVKYEIWHFHLAALRAAGVPSFLVAANFRPEQIFFQSYGAWYRKSLTYFTGIITQTAAAKALLANKGNYPTEQLFVAGDPRMDRVLAITQVPFTDEKIAAFVGDSPVFIVGSGWPQDLAVILEAWPELPQTWKLIYAPHQLREAELTTTAEALGAARYASTKPDELARERVLLLDTIGILSRVYRYGKIAYVGGGFKTGLHSTLEPMAYGLPVIFGPKHQKFPEAAAAITAGGAFSVSDADELSGVLSTLQEPTAYNSASEAQRQLCAANAGAGERTADLILQQLNP